MIVHCYYGTAHTDQSGCIHMCPYTSTAGPGFGKKAVIPSWIKHTSRPNKAGGCGLVT